MNYFNSEIAAELNVPRATVANTLKSLLKTAEDLGFPTIAARGYWKGKRMPPRKRAARQPIDTERILQLWDAGKLVSEIAPIVGSSKFIVRRALRENGRIVTHSISSTIIMNNPERKAKQREILKRVMTNPQVVAKRNAACAASLKSLWVNPEMRSRMAHKSHDRGRTIDRPRMVELWNAGWTVKEIHAELGTSELTIRGVLKKNCLDYSAPEARVRQYETISNQASI